jgi:spore coat polysaccharide biosynthesis predicted glycosyltransferase SpsG
MNKTLLKIKLRNKGIKVLPKSYLPNGTVILSLSLPKYIMRKFSKLKLMYGPHEKTQMLKDLLQNFNFKKVRFKKKMYSNEFEQYIIDNDLILSKSFKHIDYEFNSIVITIDIYKKLKYIANYYQISRSSLIRILVEAFNYKNFHSYKT